MCRYKKWGNEKESSREGGERREELRGGERGEKVRRGRYLGNLFLYWLDIFLCEVSPHKTHTAVDVKTNTT